MQIVKITKHKEEKFGLKILFYIIFTKKINFYILENL